MLRANYQDGRSTQVREVVLAPSDGGLAVVGSNIDFRIPIEKIVVDERLGRAPRRLRFPDGSFCEVRDLDALDILLASLGHRDGWIDRLQRHLPFVGFSIIAFAAILVAAYVFLLPWAVEIVARHIPPSVDEAISAQTIKALDNSLFDPSELSEARQESLTAAFQDLQVAGGGASHAALLFRKSARLHANAFTLPDGTIIILDDLVALMASDGEILAVLSHELGHADKRHSLQMLLRSSVVAAFWTFYVGDISTLLAAAPATIAQARYSQEFERAADDYGAQVLLNNGMSPALLADALQKLKAAYPAAAEGGYFSTHPATDERMTRLRDQATPGLRPK